MFHIEKLLGMLLCIVISLLRALHACTVALLPLERVLQCWFQVRLSCSSIDSERARAPFGLFG